MALSEHLQSIRDGVQAVCNDFGDDYWLARDDDGIFPHDFHGALAEAGWLGITMPQEYGGAGLGVSEAVIMMHTIAKTGAMSAASCIHINMFGPHPILVYTPSSPCSHFCSICWASSSIGASLVARSGSPHCWVSMATCS